MSEKKHKSGYDILKERVADLENDVAFYRRQYRDVSKERDRLKEELSMQIAPDFETFKRVERERDEWKKSSDEWKAKFECKSSPVFRANEKLGAELVDTEEKLAFLLKHCPFWVRWKFRKQFEKGGEK